MKSRETETFTRPDILSLGGTETSTETTKVSAPRPPISGRIDQGHVKYFMVTYHIMVGQVIRYLGSTLARPLIAGAVLLPDWQVPGHIAIPWGNQATLCWSTNQMQPHQHFLEPSGLQVRMGVGDLLSQW